MEIKAILKKPCTPEQLELFKVENNHRKSYEIIQTEEEYQAWGKTQDEIKDDEFNEILNLKMTRGDFFEGLILAKGIDEDDILNLINELELDNITKKIFKSRVKNALDFYRGYPLVDMLGLKLGLTSEQLNNFFKTKDYNSLKEDINESI